MAELKQNANRANPNVRFLGQTALTTLLWASTLMATRADWFARATALPARIALVAIGLGGFVPVVFLYAKAIRMQDEFNQRMHLIALGVAFALLGVTSYTVDLLHRASFIPQPSSSGLWGLMIAIWMTAMLVMSRLSR